MSMNLNNFKGQAQGLAEPTPELLGYLHTAEIDNRPFIDGGFVDPISDAVMKNISPINGELIIEFSAGDRRDIDRAVASARRAFEAGNWSRASLQTRRKILLSIAEEIERLADQFAALDCVDVGKPFSMAKGVDVAVAVDTFRWYAELVDKLHSNMAPTDHFDLLIREPMGVVGAVTPWNYPLMIAAWKTAPMLAAGNSVVLKPAEQSPLSALLLAQAAANAGLPPGVLNVVPGDGPEAGQSLGLHPDVDAVGFTGSSEIGKKFLVYSGQSNMKRVSLECGGKSPLIVFDDANPKKAAEALASAVFYNAGQSCNAPARALLHESIQEEFLDELKAQIDNYQPNNALNVDASVGSIVDQAQLDSIMGFIERAVADGAKLHAGGGRMFGDSAGFYIEPTIITNTTQNMEVNQEEIFGPVVPVQTFSSDEDAIKLANDTKYGLWANIWTNDLSRSLLLARGVQAGTVAFNTVWGGDNSTPMGGYKQSGIGRDRGVEGMKKYMELKHVSLLPQGS